MYPAVDGFWDSEIILDEARAYERAYIEFLCTSKYLQLWSSSEKLSLIHTEVMGIGPQAEELCKTVDRKAIRSAVSIDGGDSGPGDGPLSSGVLGPIVSEQFYWNPPANAVKMLVRIVVICFQTDELQATSSQSDVSTLWTVCTLPRTTPLDGKGLSSSKVGHGYNRGYRKVNPHPYPSNPYPARVGYKTRAGKPTVPQPPAGRSTRRPTRRVYLPG
ncbi:hypothetical protein DFH08DRAFT_820804 [Mycena albidolilacea]|uniref:Uncharacterized protein n=1 Tax=Mycena albidolilacea TaxID=1033008 RepID=A0AAD7EEA7_9AGAR|nr:hypothetical protein DFH08DRAFT_820804 [Mycena albidolilacea]